MSNKLESTYHWRGSLLVALLATFLALLTRGYQLEAIQFKFDDWLGAYHPGPALSFRDGPGKIIRQIHETSQHYMASTMTILYNVTCQTIKLFTGPDFTAMRWWFAVAGALGVGLAALVAARLYGPWSAPAWSVILMGATSITSIVFSQFADNFAFTALMTMGQVAVYLKFVRGRWNWSGFLLLAVVTYSAQLGMYTQFLVTTGIFLAAFLEISFYSRTVRSYLSWLLGGLVYVWLSFLHFYATYLVIPWTESFRSYMASYYPLGLLGKGAFQAGWDHSWWGYYLFRLYDLLNYHWSLVFNPKIYLPLEWNWVSLPFLLVVAAAVACWIGNRKSKRSEENGEQLAVSSKQSALSGEQLPLAAHRSLLTGSSPPLTAHRLPLTEKGNGVLLILIATVFCHMVANRVLFITFGGTRQCVYLAPLLWFGYAEAVRRITETLRSRFRLLSRAVGLLLVFLTVVPFALSWPGLYRTRVSRVDLDAVIAAIHRYHPEKIVASHDSIQSVQMTMLADPRFSDIFWPGYPYESDMLDADISGEPPYVSFTLEGKKYKLELAEKENFPREGTNLLYLDTFIPHNDQHQDSPLLGFYTPLDQMISPEQEVIPLLESPGNAPYTVHQSIYWPPNAFYLYRVVKN